MFFLMIPRPPRSTRTDTLFPTRRSSDLPRHRPLVDAPPAFSLVAERRRRAALRPRRTGRPPRHPLRRRRRVGDRGGAALVARRTPDLRLAPAELRPRSGARGRGALRTDPRGNARQRRATRLGFDPAARPRPPRPRT